jgi:hypothetical protein
LWLGIPQDSRPPRFRRISFLLFISSGPASHALTATKGTRIKPAICACVNRIDFRSFRKVSACIVSERTTRTALLTVPGGTQKEIRPKGQPQKGGSSHSDEGRLLCSYRPVMGDRALCELAAP